MRKSIKIKTTSNSNNKTAKKNLRNKKEKPDVQMIGLEPFECVLSQKKKKETSIEGIKKFRKQLNAFILQKGIDPKKNFYDFINANWIKKVSLNKEQRYITQIDDFRLIQDKVYKDINNIILDYIKSNDTILSRNLHNFYDSVVNMNSITSSKNIIDKIIIKIDELLSDKNGLWKLLAYVNENEIIPVGGCPFIWSMDPDDKNHKIYRCSVNGPQFSILDLSVYYDDGTNIKYKSQMRNKFFKFNEELFNTVLGNSHGLNPNDIFDVETEIFVAYGCTKVTHKEESVYNKVTKNEAMDKYNFNWEEFSKELGFKSTPSFFITSSLNYLKCGTELFIKNWNTEKWRTYWIWLFVKAVARMTKSWEKIIYKFYGESQRGQEELNTNDAVSVSLYMSIPFNTFLTKQYIEKHQKPEEIEMIKLLCHELRIVFINIIKKNTWLSERTKKYAMTKLEKIKFIIGHPNNLREDPTLNYDEDLYKNMEKIMKWRHKRFIELEGKNIIDIPMVDWTQYPIKMVGTQAYIVNASYTPSENSIYINQGYIQKPFIDLRERGIEYNLAHIGFTIGHEMSHALDDWGSQYDYNGNLYDWWTPEDKKKYKSIQNDVIKQYEEFAARDGVKFDASISVGEDLADISGLAICSNYLWDFQEHYSDIIPIKKTSFDAFYCYFAFQQKQKISKKTLNAQLKTNPHPPDKYRCNVPLSRSIIFRILYNVKKGDGMWWHNTNTIW